MCEFFTADVTFFSKDKTIFRALLRSIVAFVINRSQNDGSSCQDFLSFLPACITWAPMSQSDRQAAMREEAFLSIQSNQRQVLRNYSLNWHSKLCPIVPPDLQLGNSVAWLFWTIFFPKITYRDGFQFYSSFFYSVFLQKFKCEPKT